MDIFDFAMKMELDGKDFYTRLATESNCQGLKQIFADLAADEQKHYEIFSRLKAQQPLAGMADSRALETARNLFAELKVDLSSGNGLGSNLEAYRYAMKVEKESETIYLEAAEKEENEEVRKLLLKIVVEERKHYNIIENIYDFVSAPTQSLVWAEATNLDEFKFE